jgi:transposase-like protein
MIAQRNAPQTLSEAIRFFADPDAAFQTIMQLRWPDGNVTCPRCGGEKPLFIRTRYLWTCRECKRQFSAKIGTIFEDSPLGWDKWLPAIWLLANAKNGISSYELARSLGVTQKTGWFMLHRIRLAMQTQSFEKMGGTVELDETYIGGKLKNMHAEKRARRNPRNPHHQMEAVMGMLQRKRGSKHSTVRLAHIENVRANTLDTLVRTNVEPGSNLYTDTLKSYQQLGMFKWKRDGYKHAAVDHAVTYVDGQVHTNGLENFWSLLKRTIRGTYVSVDPFHLFRYLDEQAYRFNNRDGNDWTRFLGVLKDVVRKRLTYNELISADMVPSTT